MSNTIDSSVAAWQASTIAAAESYEEAEADRAHAERQAAEEAAANGQRDGFDPPPTSQDRALDSFWANDPNRPASTYPSSGNSASDGRTPISAEDANLLREAGYNVVEEGGNFYLEGATAEVSVTEQPEPEWLPPPLILPSNSNTSAPGDPDADASPAPSQTNGGPANVTDAGAPGGTGEADLTISTVLGAETNKLLNLSSALQKEWAALQDKGWKVTFGEPGKGSFANRNGTPPTIVLDPNLKGDPTLLAETFSHEVGHASFNLRPEISSDGLTRKEYIQQNLNRHLDDEGAANFRNAQVRQEVQMNGGPEDFGINGTQDAKYHAIYDDYKAGRLSEEQAAHQMGQVFADGEHTSTTGQTYREYYSSEYQKKWDKDHGGAP